MPLVTRLLSELDRLGPGNAESLRWALGVVGLAPDAIVLDAGCGTGADLGTLLAAVPQGRVVALDRVQAFVDTARQRFVRVDARVGDYTDPPGGPFDLIWSAGAAYAVGVRAALESWRGHLTAGGRVAFSDIRWRGDTRPGAVRDFFESRQGVALGDVPALEAEVAQAGYRILNARWLGAPGWTSYYGPLEAALDTVETEPAEYTALRAEIALWRTYGVHYGCRIIVCEIVEK